MNVFPRYSSALSFVRPNNVTAYTALDVIGTSAAAGFKVPSIAPVGGGQIMLLHVLFSYVSETPISGVGNIRLHFYTSQPQASLVDNSAFSLGTLIADYGIYAGHITLGAPAANGGICLSQDYYVRKAINATSSSLWVVVQTLSGFTPLNYLGVRLKMEAVELS